MKQSLQNKEFDFLFIPNNKIKKVALTIVVVFLLIIVYTIVSSYVLVNDDAILRSLLFLAIVNCMCALIFVEYTKVNINRYLLNIISIQLLLMVLIYFISITSIPIKIGEQGLYTLNIFMSSLLIHLVIFTQKEHINKKLVLMKYILLLITVAIIFWFYKKTFISFDIFTKIIYFLNILILSFTFITTTRKMKLSIKTNRIDILLMLIILIVDIIFIIHKEKIEIIWILRIFRYTITNLFIYTFTLNIIAVGKTLQFKELMIMNEELEKLNEGLREKNTQLENSRNNDIKLDSLYKEFLQIIDMPIVIFNNSNNRIKYINKEFLKLVKKNELRDIINKKISEYLELDLKELSQLSYDKNMTILSYLEYYDEIRVLEINIDYLNDSENIAIINDITEKRNIHKLKKEIKQKRKNENMKKNFLSNISHDLKTPIGVIFSATQLQDVYLCNNINSEILKYNKVCLENCVYLNRLTNNIMDISRISENSLKPKFEIDNIVYFIEEKIHYINELAKIKNINIVFDTEKEEIFVSFDKEFTERIIFNLLSNAIKYSQNRSEVMVNIRIDRNIVKIEIIDSGIGMSKKFIEKAFKLYSMETQVENNSTSNMEKGTGIGLYVVYKLAKLQNADITIESELGIGSKFTLSFLKVIHYEK